MKEPIKAMESKIINKKPAQICPYCKSQFFPDNNWAGAEECRRECYKKELKNASRRKPKCDSSEA